MKWADLLRVDRAALGAKQARAYHRWVVRSQLAKNVPLDRFARAIVTAEGPLDEVPQASFFKAVKRPGDQAAARRRYSWACGSPAPSAITPVRPLGPGRLSRDVGVLLRRALREGGAGV